MTKVFSKLTVICACSMLSASAWAQADSQNNPPTNLYPDQASKSWSTKQLSATGRMNEHPVRASKLVGAQVNDSSGNHAGQIQDIIVNPTSGRIEFALLSLGATGTSPVSSDKLVPVPWSLLKVSTSSQYSTSSDQPTFTLNADQNKLNNAPTLGSTDLNQSQWRQRVCSYYGVSPEGELKGDGAQKLLQPVPQLQP